MDFFEFDFGYKSKSLELFNIGATKVTVQLKLTKVINDQVRSRGYTTVDGNAKSLHLDLDPYFAFKTTNNNYFIMTPADQYFLVERGFIKNIEKWLADENTFMREVTGEWVVSKDNKIDFMLSTESKSLEFKPAVIRYPSGETEIGINMNILQFGSAIDSIFLSATKNWPLFAYIMKKGDLYSYALQLLAVN